MRWLPRLGCWRRRSPGARRARTRDLAVPLLGVSFALLPILADSARPAAVPAARRPAALASASGQVEPAPKGPETAPGHGEPAPVHAAPAPMRYRVVGCRSRGGPYRGGPGRREVAIGFDDGPAADTRAFVSMLERADAPATFFMIGRQLGPGLKDLLLRELRDGDVLGDHTYSHPDLLTTGGTFSQLGRPLAEIRALSGYTPCVFRPPYGAYDSAVLATARSLGLATVLWNVDPTDWSQPGAAAIVQRVLAQVRPGSIIISHDGGGPRWQTLAAYPTIIRALRARGYRIVTIPELLGFRPVYVPCVRLCEGIGVLRARLPRNAILQRAP